MLAGARAGFVSVFNSFSGKQGLVQTLLCQGWTLSCQWSFKRRKVVLTFEAVPRVKSLRVNECLGSISAGLFPEQWLVFETNKCCAAVQH